MRIFKSAFTGKGLLVVAIALLSGGALAETAGRVSFVNGEVTASAADGSSRVLRRGDSINGGDKISTRGGRVQIRFTDGGFVSLHPNSVFGVDEYLFANRKPQESSLFFSLLQGGMRTITGAIGKVNKQSYKVRTPVATIGIRGTEYLASVDGDSLKVSVGSGLVYVENGQGNVTGGAGQNILVKGATQPPQLSEEKVELQAPGVTGDEIDTADDGPAGGTVAIGDVLDAGGRPLLVIPGSFVSGPGYTLAYSYRVGTGVQGGYPAGPNSSDTSLNVTFDGGMRSASVAGGTTLFDRGDALEVPEHGGQTGALKWGAWYPSGLSDGGSLITMNGSLDFVSQLNNEFVNYIVGYLTPSSVFSSYQGLSGYYTFQGGTPVFASDGTSGYLDKDTSYIYVFFNSTAASLSANLNFVINDVDGSNNPAPSTFSVSGGYSVSASQPTFSGAAGCTGGINGCTASLSGFIAGAQGEQVGLGYQVIDSASRNIEGTAAFGRTSLSAAAQ